jgi:hypothetical protein
MQRPDISLPANWREGGIGMCGCVFVYVVYEHTGIRGYAYTSVCESACSLLSSLSLSHPPPAAPSLSICISLIMETGACQSVHLSALAAAAAPQPPPLLTSEIALVPVRPVTEQQLVGRGEKIQ